MVHTTFSAVQISRVEYCCDMMTDIPSAIGCDQQRQMLTCVKCISRSQLLIDLGSSLDCYVYDECACHSPFSLTSSATAGCRILPESYRKGVKIGRQFTVWSGMVDGLVTMTSLEMDSNSGGSQ
jgi:hypothetical protein